MARLAIILEIIIFAVGSLGCNSTVVAFLAGPESGWVTGQSFSVDGGLEQGKAPDFLDTSIGREAMDSIRQGNLPG